MILQMVILHNSIKTIHNGVFVFFWKKNKYLFHFKNPEVNGLKNRNFEFFYKRCFSTLTIFQNFFRDLPLIARSGTSHVTVSLIGRAPYTYGDEEAENYSTGMNT